MRFDTKPTENRYSKQEFQHKELLLVIRGNLKQGCSVVVIIARCWEKKEISNSNK